MFSYTHFIVALLENHIQFNEMILKSNRFVSLGKVFYY